MRLHPTTKLLYLAMDSQMQFAVMSIAKYYKKAFKLIQANKAAKGATCVKCRSIKSRASLGQSI